MKKLSKNKLQKAQKEIEPKESTEVDNAPARMQLSEGLPEQDQIHSVGEEHLTPFSSLLCKIIGRDRAEIAQIARKLDVSENTIYRWMNGISEPRSMYLKRLIEIFPSHHESLTYAIHQTFGSMPEAPIQTLDGVRKEIYRSVLEILSTVADRSARFWQIAQAIFDYGLHHMDRENRGLAMTFAKVMPPYEDGIHSLIEVLVRGTPPWPHSTESKAYLGSTTLAGTAAELQRIQIWDDSDASNRAQVEVDQFERSACAVPVTRGSLIGGVLIVSSAQSGFFREPTVCQIVAEYALMMGVALADQDFYPSELLCLRPMPHLRWQHKELAISYRDRLVAYARTHGKPFREAEAQVQRDLEREFEQKAYSELEHA
jgi:transcriptional regulator with XRE-family HTH domain